MIEQTLLEQIIQQVIADVQGQPAPAPSAPAPAPPAPAVQPVGEATQTQTQTQKRCDPPPSTLHPLDEEALARMIARTPARIGVGRCGARLITATQLKLRADHAAARDAVFMEVDAELIKELGLLRLQTMCEDKNTFVTRPDLGRDFPEEMLEKLHKNCVQKPQVQLIVSDGLSSTAVSANARNILPVIQDGLKAKGITVGTPLFVRFGRVGAQDRIAQAVGAEVVCSLIGERPGLATAESMSAYLAYRAEPGMPEARRSVVSNIHKGGIPAVEAGAYIVDLICTILQQRVSGVDLKK